MRTDHGRGSRGSYRGNSRGRSDRGRDGEDVMRSYRGRDGEEFARGDRGRDGDEVARSDRGREFEEASRVEHGRIGPVSRMTGRGAAPKEPTKIGLGRGHAEGAAADDESRMGKLFSLHYVRI